MNEVVKYTPATPAPRSDRARNAPLSEAHIVVGTRPHSSTPRQAVRLEIRCGRNAMRVHAYVRISTDDDMSFGHGSAGGGGYHKPSAAASAAIASAGYKLENPFGGHGEGAMHDALIAIARFNGYSNCTVITITD